MYRFKQLFQEGCAAQLGDQKAWQEHVEAHKAKLKTKIINSEVGAASIRIRAADTNQTLKLPVKGGAHVQ